MISTHWGLVYYQISFYHAMPNCSLLRPVGIALILKSKDISYLLFCKSVKFNKPVIYLDFDCSSRHSFAPPSANASIYYVMNLKFSLLHPKKKYFKSYFKNINLIPFIEQGPPNEEM